jgi:hypothetical protein
MLLYGHASAHATTNTEPLGQATPQYLLDMQPQMARQRGMARAGPDPEALELPRATQSVTQYTVYPFALARPVRGG